MRFMPNGQMIPPNNMPNGPYGMAPNGQYYGPNGPIPVSGMQMPNGMMPNGMPMYNGQMPPTTSMEMQCQMTPNGQMPPGYMPRFPPGMMPNSMPGSMPGTPNGALPGMIGPNGMRLPFPPQMDMSKYSIKYDNSQLNLQTWRDPIALLKCSTTSGTTICPNLLRIWTHAFQAKRSTIMETETLNHRTCHQRPTLQITLLRTELNYPQFLNLQVLQVTRTFTL
jgi:hypothetical protein